MLDKGIFYRKIWAQGPGTSEKDVFLVLWGESPHAYLSSDCFPDPTLPV